MADIPLSCPARPRSCLPSPAGGWGGRGPCGDRRSERGGQVGAEGWDRQLGPPGRRRGGWRAHRRGPAPVAHGRRGRLYYVRTRGRAMHPPRDLGVLRDGVLVAPAGVWPWRSVPSCTPMLSCYSLAGEHSCAPWAEASPGRVPASYRLTSRAATSGTWRRRRSCGRWWGR